MVSLCVQRLTFGKVALVDKTRNDVAVLKIEIIVRAKNIGRNDASKHTAILLVVGPGERGS